VIYREYGRTGKKVSVLGFGGMRFRREDSNEQAAELVLRAAELGINYFDTAPYYCEDRSEDIFGLALSQLRQPVYISTKSNENDAEKLRRSLERSLSRLKVDRIHFFHFWCVLNMERIEQAQKGGVFEELQKAKEEGLIEHIVFSTHQPSSEIIEVIRMGIFEGVTLGYNIINFPFRKDAVLAAHRAGLGVVTMNPLAGGVIPRNAERFAFIREGERWSVAASALRFNMAHPEITVVLAGISTLEELEENVAAVDRLPELTPERLRQLEAKIESSMDSICTGCGYCLPCPEGIEIPKYMDAYNLFLLGGTAKDVKDRLKWHWGLDLMPLDRCTECRTCEETCTQYVPILERFEKLRSLIHSLEQETAGEE